MPHSDVYVFTVGQARSQSKRGKKWNFPNSGKIPDIVPLHETKTICVWVPHQRTNTVDFEANRSHFLNIYHSSDSRAAVVSQQYHSLSHDTGSLWTVVVQI